MCIFVGYPKGLRGGFFYSHKDNKYFVSINATFLEKDYMKNYKSKSKVIVEEITEETSTPSVLNVETFIVDKILSYRRTNTEIIIPKVELQ